MPQKINIILVYLINLGHYFLPFSHPDSERQVSTLSMQESYRKIATQTSKMSLLYFLTIIYLSAIGQYLKILCVFYLKDEFLLNLRACQYIFNLWRKCYLSKTATFYFLRSYYHLKQWSKNFGELPYSTFYNMTSFLTKFTKTICFKWIKHHWKFNKQSRNISKSLNLVSNNHK